MLYRSHSIFSKVHFRIWDVDAIVLKVDHLKNFPRFILSQVVLILCSTSYMPKHYINSFWPPELCWLSGKVSGAKTCEPYVKIHIHTSDVNVAGPVTSALKLQICQTEPACHLKISNGWRVRTLNNFAFLFKFLNMHFATRSVKLDLKKLLGCTL